MKKKIMVVEDELMICMLVEEIILAMGHEIVGPAHSVESALKLIETEKIDFATLDVNLGRSLVYPVADKLKEKGIPFVFSTGYGVNGLDDIYKNNPVISKPFTEKMFMAKLGMVMGCG